MSRLPNKCSSDDISSHESSSQYFIYWSMLKCWQRIFISHSGIDSIRMKATQRNHLTSYSRQSHRLRQGRVPSRCDAMIHTGFALWAMLSACFYVWPQALGLCLVSMNRVDSINQAIDAWKHWKATLSSDPCHSSSAADNTARQVHGNSSIDRLYLFIPYRIASYWPATWPISLIYS